MHSKKCIFLFAPAHVRVSIPFRDNYFILAEEKCKNIVIESLRFLIENKRTGLNALVIMNNHLQLNTYIGGEYQRSRNTYSLAALR